MTNPVRHNRFHMSQSGVCGSSGQFGDLFYAHAKWHVPGNGHREYVRVDFVGGFFMEITRETAVMLIAELPAAVAALPEIPDCSGAVADVGEG